MKLLIPILELLGFFICVCGVALWLIHDMYTVATVIMAIGGVMIVAGMLIEKYVVGYYED